ncbi:MAG: hypothetical protein E7333_01110 [Clostridiales bacterium]|nr:hypothetical protein [Clostridiales bacterium]
MEGGGFMGRRRNIVAALLMVLCLAWSAFNSTTCLLTLTRQNADDQEAVAVFSSVESTFDPKETPPLVESAETFRVEVITHEAALESKSPYRILIYHTHTWEAYEQVPDAPYVETEKWRSKDETVNMVAVGKALASTLSALGCNVVHDTTAFEPPDLSDAYDRSLTMLTSRKNSGETYDLYLDVHRDGIASTSTIKRTVTIGGEKVARFMVLVGKGTYYNEKPDWETNFQLAEMVTDALNQQCDSLCRDVKVKTGRYNQHIGPLCLLLECGTNENTLEEVLRGIPYLADALVEALDKALQNN